MTRIDEKLFVGSHYLGKPAELTDRIIQKRVDLVRQIPNFCDKNLDLVDVGCGNGASMFLLSDQMNSCTGLELFENHRQEFNNIRTHKNTRNCEFIHIDIEKQNFESQFDRLICFEVIEHFADEKNVQKLYNLLKKGGKAAISVPNKWWIFETHGAKLPLLKWNRVPFFSWLPTKIHEKYANARIYTQKRIQDLLQNVGFQIVDTQYITAPLDVLKDGKLKDFLLENIFVGNTTEIPFLSTSIFISLQKN
ncbi:MAG: class I SAM-dependent methyltransferase [Bacteroidetes bacterium]|nr:MAG: class I SAM-dependent methyltransferase [Bacteroidota bacterium]